MDSWKYQVPQVELKKKKKLTRREKLEEKLSQQFEFKKMKESFVLKAAADYKARL